MTCTDRRVIGVARKDAVTSGPQAVRSEDAASGTDGRRDVCGAPWQVPHRSLFLKRLPVR